MEYNSKKNNRERSVEEENPKHIRWIYEWSHRKPTSYFMFHFRQSTHNRPQDSWKVCQA